MKSFGKVWLSIGIVVIVLGIGLLVVNIINGFTIKDIPTISEDMSFADEDIKAIEISIDYGDLSIVEGDGFYIKGENIPKDSLKVSVDKKGTWSIQQNSNYIVKVFGVDVSLGDLTWWDNNLKQRIEITIPEDFVASDFSLEFGAGSAKIHKIQADHTKLSIGAGKIDIDDIQITDQAKIEVGAGEMTVNAMEVKNLTVECGVGNIRMKGTITGDNNINCGIGKVTMDLQGSLEDYNFYVDKGIGNVNINGKSYHSIRQFINTSPNAMNRIDLDCGIGNIEINLE